MMKTNRYGLISSISQQKDSTQQRLSMELASAKAHWLILQLKPIKSCEGIYSCRQADDIGGENDAKHHEGLKHLFALHTSFRLIQLWLKAQMSWFKLEVLDVHDWWCEYNERDFRCTMASVSEIKPFKEVVEEDLALVGKNSGRFSKASEAMDQFDRFIN